VRVWARWGEAAVFDLIDERERADERKRLYGAYPAEVTNLSDPDGQGRVKIRLPWSPDTNGGSYEVWARLAVPMAGNNRGTWFIPDPGDEVLVMFEAGDPRRPYVVGALWNGSDTPPESMDDAGDNLIKSVVSRRDIRITLDDTEGEETVTIQTPGGQQVIIKDGPGEVELRDSAGNMVKLESAGITVSAAASVTIQAGTVEVSANKVNVNAGMTKFSGVVKAETVITNSVVSSKYTPGMGNLL
jgi:uncharacterized protein involved in type VI secretion and phage assembly